MLTVNVYVRNLLLTRFLLKLPVVVTGFNIWITICTAGLVCIFYTALVS